MIELAWRQVTQIDNVATGRRVRDARIRAQMRMEDLANRINISRTTMHRLETGAAEWTQELIDDVNKVLG